MDNRKINVSLEFGNPQVYNDLGNSPKLLESLCAWLVKNKNRILSIDIALYLFNNKYLFSVLKQLADSDCQVNIYSIPLEGYDTTPYPITSHKDNLCLGKYSKYDFAKEVYNEILKLGHPKLTLFIMPHMYIRSDNVSPFSRGKMPYSLHCKSYMVQFRNGSSYAGLTSSNFAVRDAQKIELACIMPLGENEKKSTMDFYQGLKENSIPASSFNSKNDYKHYEIKLRPIPKQSQAIYIAPFYKNSSVDFENTLIHLIHTAKKRIVVAAQHIASYKYSYHTTGSSNNPGDAYITKNGFLKNVLAKVEQGIPTTFISQTYADNITRNEIRKPQNTKSFSDFAFAAKKTKACNYYVNSNLHAKYILIDDIAILTTCNFTPSQFIYLPHVNITRFKNIPDASYSGIFCEYGAYFITQNSITCKQLLDYTDAICSLEDTKKII